MNCSARAEYRMWAELQCSAGYSDERTYRLHQIQKQGEVALEQPVGIGEAIADGQRFYPRGRGPEIG